MTAETSYVLFIAVNSAPIYRGHLIFVGWMDEQDYENCSITYLGLHHSKFQGLKPHTQ